MIVNNKFFVQPYKSSDNFKVLFARLAAEGVGRPADRHGFADGPWTPEALADAISVQEGNHKGIELRAVQVWFQDNDNGIGDENIRWLARVFGCNDPEAASQWQAELKAAKDRLTKERRERRELTSKTNRATDKSDGALDAASLSERGTPEVPQWDSQAVETPEYRGSKFVCSINNLITNSNNLHLLILIWGGWAVIAVSATILGLGDISYPISNETKKEVGFWLSPTWTVEKIVLVPTYIFITSRAVAAWLRHREALPRGSFNETWEERISSYKIAFVAITAICAFVVFGLQWYGNYLVFPT